MGKHPFDHSLMTVKITIIFSVKITIIFLNFGTDITELIEHHSNRIKCCFKGSQGTTQGTMANLGSNTPSFLWETTPPVTEYCAESKEGIVQKKCRTRLSQYQVI